METNTNKVVLKRTVQPNTDDVVPKRTVVTVAEEFVLTRTVNEADGEDFVLKRTVETKQKTSRGKKRYPNGQGFAGRRRFAVPNLEKTGFI